MCTSDPAYVKAAVTKKIRQHRDLIQNMNKTSTTVRAETIPLVYERSTHQLSESYVQFLDKIAKASREPGARRVLHLPQMIATIVALGAAGTTSIVQKAYARDHHAEVRAIIRQHMPAASLRSVSASD